MSKSSCLASMQVLYSKGKEKEKRSVMLNVFESILKAVDNGTVVVQENYSAVSRIEKNKRTLRFHFKDNRQPLEFRRETGLTDPVWEEFVETIETRVHHASVRKSPFTRGSSAREIDHDYAPVPFSLNENKRVTVPSPITGRGIKNTGNSCYFNAILQALTGLPTFICDLKDKRVRDAGLEEDSCFMTLIQITNQSAERSQIPIDPKKAQNAVSKRHKQFASRTQQDAHELLGTFLQILESEISPYLKRKKESLKLQSKLLDLPLAERPGLFCPTKRNFSFVIKKTFICSGCKDSHEVLEIFRDLSLEIFDYEDLLGWETSDLSAEVKQWIQSVANPLTVQDMLRFYFLPEPIERLCKCGCEQTIIKKKIVSLPRIFIFHVKRFVHFNLVMKKINSKVGISTEIKLDEKFASPAHGMIKFDTGLLKNKAVQSSSEGEASIDDGDVTKSSDDEEAMVKESPVSQASLKSFEEVKGNVTSLDNKKYYNCSTDTESSDNSESSSEHYLNTVQEEIEELGFAKGTKETREPYNDTYRLKCIVHHLGSKVTSGHYTAEIFDYWKKQWYLYNDSKVSKSVPEMRKSTTAYILFYVNDGCWPQDS